MNDGGNVHNILFRLAGYPAVFYCPVLVVHPAKMLNGTGYRN